MKINKVVLFAMVALVSGSSAFAEVGKMEKSEIRDGQMICKESAGLKGSAEKIASFGGAKASVETSSASESAK